MASHPDAALRAARGPAGGRPRPLDKAPLRYVQAFWGQGRSRLHDLAYLYWRSEIVDQGRRLEALDDAALRAAARDLGGRLRRHGFRYRTVAHAFALVRECSRRRLGMAHHDCQLRGGWAMLWGGVAEMATGEGKTLTAVLPVATMAMAGVPCHVVSVNDYLTERDAGQMRPVYEAVGLRVAHVVSSLSPDERRRAYEADVTYCTNQELVFDYLRDRIALAGRPGRIRLELDRWLGEEGTAAPLLNARGLGFALIDEADSVLVDEARTPLVISGPGDESDRNGMLEEAIRIARILTSGRDFLIERDRQRLQLTARGRERIDELVAGLGGVWRARRHREETLRQALSALHLFERDEHYLIDDERVVIIDEYTGRAMPNRSWSRDLHQLIEIKEGLPPTLRNETLAQISYQAFFRRYPHKAGMSGTVAEIARELGMSYDLPVVRIPTHRPVDRADLGTRVLADPDEAAERLVASVAALLEAGRPVLVGTRTVAVAEGLSERFASAGIAHRVLSARQNADEAEVVAGAGRAGQVTIATNMAGRGTDIPLDEAARAAGGLHVILTEFHGARRIDRQLVGRCARQGDPGSSEAILSLDNVEALTGRPGRLAGLLARSCLLHRPLGQAGARWLLRSAQRQVERRHYRMRQDLLRMDDEMGRTLAFSGRRE